MNGSRASVFARLWRRVRSWSLLLLLVAGLAILGTILVVFNTPPALGRPEPLAVAADDMEIVWLYPATNIASWERFVAAVQQTGDRLLASHPDLEVQVGPAAFREQTTAVPEVALKWKTSGRRLVFHWYKLTSKQNAKEWVEALAHRQPPPLAIIGGSTSDAARDVAIQLNQAADALPETQRPLLLFTTASADDFVPRADTASAAIYHYPPDDGQTVALNEIYALRTFRFCFTNRQMATAVTRFAWQQDELRPDHGMANLVCWEDDAYSRDLIRGFWRAMQIVGVSSTPDERAWTLGCLLRGAGPPDIASLLAPYQPLDADSAPGLALHIAPAWPMQIDSSVGGFDVSNPLEAHASLKCLTALVDQPKERRPLLAVTGQSAPSRRFLRALARNAPDQARRCVVVTGDAIPFNTIYRDGAVTWPIQDLPYRLVFFCHRNPIDASAGFRRMEDVRENAGDPGLTATTGTEDVLLFGDIVMALALGFERGNQFCQNAWQLGERFHDLHVREGKLNFDPTARPLFNAQGNRHSGTGEHVVYLSPEYTGQRVLPRAAIEVWSWRTEGTGDLAVSSWQRAAGSPLEMHYDWSDRQGDGQ